MLVVYFNKESARVCRRREVRQADGAYKRFEERLGDLPLEATELPSVFPELTERERVSLASKFFVRARALREQRRLEAHEERTDPMRRIQRVHALLKEVIDLSRDRPLDEQSISDIHRAVGDIVSTSPLQPLAAARDSIRAAAQAAADGCFGTRGDDAPIAGTEVARLWTEARAALIGGETGSLMRALQDNKWVKKGSER